VAAWPRAQASACDRGPTGAIPRVLPPQARGTSCGRRRRAWTPRRARVRMPCWTKRAIPQPPRKCPLRTPRRLVTSKGTPAPPVCSPRVHLAPTRPVCPGQRGQAHAVLTSRVYRAGSGQHGQAHAKASLRGEGPRPPRRASHRGPRNAGERRAFLCYLNLAKRSSQWVSVHRGTCAEPSRAKVHGAAGLSADTPLATIWARYYCVMMMLPAVI
jgi:hypothetical protein